MDGDVSLPDLELATEPIVIVTGSEGKGLSRLVRETCDQIVSIPMSSAVESLERRRRHWCRALRSGATSRNLSPRKAGRIR